MGSMDAPGYNAGRRRVTADPPIAPGRACYKPRRVRAGSSPLVIAHMAVESARLVAGNEVTATMPVAGFRERAGYHRMRTTRCPRMGAVRVPGSTRHQDARMSLVFVSGSDWPPAPARFNAPRGGLRAAGIYATNSLPRKSQKPSRGAPPACGPAAATRWTPGEGRGRRKRAPPAKTGSDEPRCT